MPEQYVEVTVNPVVHGRAVPDATPVTMIEVQFTPTKEAEVRHHVCPRCLFTYPETEMVQVGGTWYCTKYKHDLDAQAIRNPKRSVR